MVLRHHPFISYCSFDSQVSLQVQQLMAAQLAFALFGWLDAPAQSIFQDAASVVGDADQKDAKSLEDKYLVAGLRLPSCRKALSLWETGNVLHLMSPGQAALLLLLLLLQRHDVLRMANKSVRLLRSNQAILLFALYLAEMAASPI